MSEISEMTNCPNCPNHCPRSNLRCGKGRAFFAQEDADNEQPVRGEAHTERGDAHTGRGEDHGHGQEHSGHGREHSHQKGFAECDSSNPLVCTLVKAGAIAEHKSEMVRMHGGNEAELFSALTPAEQQTLAELLNKQLSTWEADHAAHHQH